MTDDERLDGLLRRTILASLLGVMAFLAGYALTFLVIAREVEDSAIADILEALDGRPAVTEMVGWVFFNAHGVNTEIRDVPIIGTTSRSFIGGDGGFTMALYAIPALLLVVSGLILAVGFRLDDPAWSTLVGASVTPGYFLATVAGLFLFEIQIAGATIAPALVTGIVLTGLVWPIAFGGFGGAIGGLWLVVRTTE